MAVTEKIQLLGKGLYKDIPDELTLKSIPTVSELDYIGAEDFEKTMLEKVFPVAIEEKINPYNLLEIDFAWVCRCLRILNYGPYHTTNMIICDDCGQTSRGEYRVNLFTVDCKPLPPGFKNNFKISKDEFISFNCDIDLHLLTIKQVMDAYKDKAFQLPNGTTNRQFARMCYMIHSLGNRATLTPLEVKLAIENEFEPADYAILKKIVSNLTDYGLRAGGRVKCPSCGSDNAAYLALVDDRFFRTTLDDLREWKRDRVEGRNSSYVLGTPSGSLS